MKRYIVLFFMIVQTVHTASLDGLEALYKNKAYQEILDVYGDQHDNNAVTWHIMGNAAHCLGKFNEAYLYWLRAQQYGNAYIYRISTKNIDILHKQGIVPSEHKMYTWLIWLSKYVGIYILQFFFLLMWYALWVMLYKMKRSFLAMSGIILAACCLLAPIFAAYHFHQERGLIMEDTIIYNGPNSAYYTVGAVPKGALVKVKNMQDDWMKITYNNTVGWIGRTNVELLRTHNA